MRLNYKIYEHYYSFLKFWQGGCRYDGHGCVYPEFENYKNECEKIWTDWHKAGSRGKLPVMPPATIECQKCKYADLTLGRICGRASLTVISRSADGTIPVPLLGRKKVWLDNMNQKMLNDAIKDMSPDLEAFAISGSPSVIDFSFLEKFPKLKFVYLWWNNKVEKLWGFIKTPEVEFLYIDSFNRLSDISELKNAKKLRYLSITPGMNSPIGCLSSIKPLENLPALEYLHLDIKAADRDIRPVITLPSLKYFDLHFNNFDIESYAMFEARRPDVAISFFEGIDKFSKDGKEKDSDFVGLAGKGQGLTTYGNKAKIKKHLEKYHSLKQKYLNEDYVPVLKASVKLSPAENWRQVLADGIDLHTEKEIDEIEKILTDYANRITSGVSKGQAKNMLKEVIRKITEFNERTDFIETEERQEIYDYLSSFFNKKWYDEFEELLSEVDW